MLNTKTPLITLLLCLTPLACGGPGKVTGGGVVHGLFGSDATFAFHGDTCDGDLLNPKGHFNYVDHDYGVKMNGDLLALEECTDAVDECEVCLEVEALFGLPANFTSLTHYVGVFEYRSTNHDYPGEGTGVACLADYGEGAGADDDVLILAVIDGPYHDYVQIGPVQGNIQAHECPEQSEPEPAPAPEPEPEPEPG